MPVNAKVASAYVDLVARTESFKKALDDANVQVRKFSSDMRQSTEQARGSIALLGEQFGVVLPRHLRDFVAKLPGVSSAMSAAFDAVAVIALIDIVVKAGEKIEQFITKNQEAARKNEATWASLHTSITDQNDDLDQTKIKLENAIAELEHKPENKLAEAIADARVEADKLGEKIDSVVKQIEEAVKGEQSGALSQLLLHQRGGTKTAKVVETLQLRLSDIDNGYVNGDPTQLRQQALQQALSALQPIIQVAHATLAQLQSNGTPLDNSSSRVEYQSASQAGRDITGLLSVSSNTQQVGVLQSKLSGLQGAKSAMSALEEADKKHLTALENDLAKKQLILGKDAQFESLYWNSVLSELHKGTDAYQDALSKANVAQLASLEKMHQEIQAANKRSIDAGPPSVLLDPTKGADELKASQTKNAEIQAQIAAAYQDEAEKIGVATGAITKHQAAIDDANARTAEYQRQLKALEDQLSDLQHNDAFDSIFGVDKANHAKEQDVQNQIDQLGGRYGVEHRSDQYSVEMTKGSEQVIQSLSDLAQAFTDTATQVKDVIIRGLDDVNNQLVNGMTGKRVNFNKVGSDVFSMVSKDALQHAEGTALKGLGIGGHKKADGYHTWVDNMPGGSGSSSATSSMGGLMGFLNDNDWLGSHMGSIFGAGGLLGSPHALGGPADAGVPIPVGELGPEVFTPSVPGSITPNSRAFGNQTHVAIDARGASDPAATQAAVNRAMAAYIPHMSNAAVQAQRDNNRRSPASRRS